MEKKKDGAHGEKNEKIDLQDMSKLLMVGFVPKLLTLLLQQYDCFNLLVKSQLVLAYRRPFPVVRLALGACAGLVFVVLSAVPLRLSNDV